MEDALLSSVDVRTVRESTRNSPDRKYLLLSAVAVCRGETLRLLDHCELPRGLQLLRLQWNSVQPRVSGSWRDFCDTQDHAGPRANKNGLGGLSVCRQFERQARLGSREGLR